MDSMRTTEAAAAGPSPAATSTWTRTSLAVRMGPRSTLAVLSAALLTACGGTGTVDFSVTDRYFLYAAEVLPSSSDFLSWTGESVTDVLFAVP
jgi:hypothetical protein